MCSKVFFSPYKKLLLTFFISDLQTVNITLRILFRPVSESLPKIYTTLGLDYEDRVLPSITNEVLKAVVVSICQISYLGVPLKAI